MKQKVSLIGWAALGLSLWAQGVVAQQGELQGEQLKQERLGFYYFGRGDVGGALRNLLPLAESGHAMSQYRVGSLEETATNFEEAKRWYLLAIEQQVLEAHHALAGMYANGLLGKQDLAAAYQLQLAAAEQGFEPSMIYVAGALERGAGVEIDVPAGLAWYQRAADQGSVLALRRLLRAYQHGEMGLAKSEADAQQLEVQLEAAAEAERQQDNDERKANFEQFREIEQRYFNGGG